MEDDIFNIRLPEVKKDLCHAIIECNKRGLIQSAKWLAEMSHGLKNVDCPKDFHNNVADGISCKEYEDYYLAKTYFDVGEFDRAAYFTRCCKSPVPKFLHLYSMYMSKEKKRLANMTDASNLNDSGHIKNLSELLSILKADYGQRKLDGYCLYLYGVVLKRLCLNDVAVNVFLESIHACPMLWASYVELAPLISGKEKLLNLNLPNHWMKHIFFGDAYIELILIDEGLKQYEDLETAGFDSCIYITSQIALAYHNKRDVDKAIAIFQSIQELDPYRLENLDKFSNLLFVKELKTEMAALAHKTVEIDKYRPETCCVVGNYYSIRCDHQKAIIYFQRALKLNPHYLAAWTLMGHEFMELKNTNAAIQSYRKAIEVNKRDYRAWYGLGQAYEILKMYHYSLYYFKNAHQMRPYDSRMLVALGESYEKLDNAENATRCYQKAYNVGDIEGIALFKLAHIYEKLGDFDNAIPAYLTYCKDDRSIADKPSLFHAYMTLATHYENLGKYDKATHFAYLCLESDEKKNEAKSLLKSMENKRVLPIDVVLPVDLDNSENSLSEMVVSDDEGNLTVPNVGGSSNTRSEDNGDDSETGENTMDISTVSMD